MSSDDADPRDRRAGHGLLFDAECGRLSLRDGSISLAARGGNRAVLESYVHLVAASRRRRPGAVADLREADLDALAQALDLDASELFTQIESILGVSPDEAAGILDRMKATSR